MMPVCPRNSCPGVARGAASGERWVRDGPFLARPHASHFCSFIYANPKQWPKVTEADVANR